MEKKRKIILFNPQPRGYCGEDDNYIIPPMSLLAVASLVDSHGFEVKIIDATVDKEYYHRIMEEARDALCIGITSMTGFQIHGGLQISMLVKEECPDLPVIWGGYHPSIFPEQTAANPYIDVVVRGQGEETFLELAEALHSRSSFENIKGIAFRQNGRIITTPERPFRDINCFPATPYHLLDVKKYIAREGDQMTFGIRTSQGCPYICGFCAELKVTKRHWSGFAASRVVDEVAYLKNNYGINNILIYDSNFCIDVERVKNIFQGIIERDFQITFRFLNARVDQIRRFDSQLWDLLKRGGCRDFLIGFEAGDEKILNYINKGTTLDDAIEARKILSRHNIRPSISLVLGFPFVDSHPISVKEEFSAILNLVDMVRNIDHDNLIHICNYTPYPGTTLFNLALKKGLKFPDTLAGWSEFNLTKVNVPWVPVKYTKMVDQLNRFIFPYVSNQFTVDWEKNYNGKWKWLKRQLHRLFCFTANMRLKFRFFYFPIEYKILYFLATRGKKRKRLYCCD